MAEIDLDAGALKYYEIFQPGLIETTAAMASNKQRFVYYTSAETAISVLRNQELWFRNVTTMNDYSEISYGLDLIRSVFSGEKGAEFRTAVEDIFPGTIDKANELLGGWEHDWKLETYIACVSAHDPDEDLHGRLSMWRAYGDTAIVINNTPMTATTDLLAVFSVPVLYFSESDLADYISVITDAILVNRTYLQGLGQEALVGYIHNMAFRLAISTKHPGFAEEKEWRLYYRPTERASLEMTEETVVLGGVPQKIYKLRLANEPENGLHGADIPSLVDRIIVGPTAFPYVIYQGFTDVLSRLSVADAASKVVVSDIPLRIG